MARRAGPEWEAPCGVQKGAAYVSSQGRPGRRTESLRRAEFQAAAIVPDAGAPEDGLCQTWLAGIPAGFGG